MAALVPIAKRGLDAVRANGGVSAPKAGKAAGKVASAAGDRVGGKLKDAVSTKVEEAGGAGGLVKEAASGLLPGGGKGGVTGVGKGRRMPIQQAVDVAVPIETAYNQFTQFEDWPQFMHRVTRVTQEDDCTISFATKIWGKSKEFEAKIDTQRPEERLRWRVAEGITHSGVVTFHELAPRLTRLEVNLDIEPGSLIEKAARGMRHVKRAVRADLARFKAFIEMQEVETGAWRGVIEHGEVVEPHDDSYDEERDYSAVEDVFGSPDGRAEEESQKQRTERFKRQAESSRSRGRSSGSSSRSSGSSGRSRGAAATKSSSSRTRSAGSRKTGGSSKRSSSSSTKRKAAGRS